ncbi:Aggregation promoting factor [Apilactobacillus kunkeei]|uniref:Aggregation promoting factor n=1 Tax=Apilactobacillus kunkeei TaxID=148814 RepID=A0A0M9DAG8_9LACO|nr:Aggregation promoting factor [Apilactobacillus kunkeei]KPN80513.1 Aggregation promoting factor [Apilactobacillus kunkeei]
MNNVTKSFIKFTVIAFTSLLILFAINFAKNDVHADASVNWQRVAEKNLSKKNIAARRWISFHESTNRYYARNGVCYGKFQLDISYLHGDKSKKNQELTANRYVASRYGSWVNAKKFWQRHHWY